MTQAEINSLRIGDQVQTGTCIGVVTRLSTDSISVTWVHGESSGESTYEHDLCHVLTIYGRAQTNPGHRQFLILQNRIVRTQGRIMEDIRRRMAEVAAADVIMHDGNVEILDELMTRLKAAASEYRQAKLAIGAIEQTYGI